MTTPFLLWLLLAPSAHAASTCATATRSFEQIRGSLIGAADTLAGNLKVSYCNLPSCYRPAASRNGNCWQTSQQTMAEAQATYATKLEKIQTFRGKMQTAFDRYSSQVKALGGEAIPDAGSGFACKGAAQSGQSAMAERKKPIMELASALKQMKLREHLRAEHQKLMSDYSTSLSKLQGKPFSYGPFSVTLECVPGTSQALTGAKESLESAISQDQALESYLEIQACKITQAEENFAALEKKCNDGAAAAADKEKNKPKDPGHPVPPANIPSAKPAEPPKLEPKPAPPVAVKPPASDDPKSPDNWGTLNKDQWKKDDEYKASVNSTVLKEGAGNEDVKNFLAKAEASGRGDYALRVQAAMNATAMDINGESNGPAPTVYQDGQVGSRTRGAINYYLSSPEYRAAFLRNLEAYGLRQ